MVGEAFGGEDEAISEGAPRCQVGNALPGWEMVVKISYTIVKVNLKLKRKDLEGIGRNWKELEMCKGGKIIPKNATCYNIR